MNILPSEIIRLLENFRPLMRLEVFETFTLLITGLLVGEAKHGMVRASVFAAGRLSTCANLGFLYDASSLSTETDGEVDRTCLAFVLRQRLARSNVLDRQQ